MNLNTHFTVHYTRRQQVTICPDNFTGLEQHRLHLVLYENSPETENTEAAVTESMLVMMMEHRVLMIQLKAVNSCDWVTSVWF